MNKIWGLTDYLYTAERYTLSTITVELKEKISEGGYAFVYKAVDIATGFEYAAKKIICQSNELVRMAEREIQTMKSLPLHENLVRLIDSAIIQTASGKVAILVLELCTGGTLVTLLEKYERNLNLSQILFILKEICSGVLAVHSAGFIHRDLKIENVLLHSKKFKLCDFGSCSSEVFDLSSASRQELMALQEKFERETTLMYRPPEMIDLYQRARVDFKGDSWMIGCIAYTLAFCRHPFQDQAQLAIVNAHFNFPGNSRFDEKFHSFVAWILNPNPVERPSVQEIFLAISEYEQRNGFNAVIRHTVKRTQKRVDRDLTDEEIAREIQIARQQMEARNAPKKKEEVNIWGVVENSAAGGNSANSGQGGVNMGWAKF
jgi:AP2-associated kinase